MSKLIVEPTATELLELVGSIGNELIQLKRELNELKARTDNGARYSMNLNRRITKIENKTNGGTAQHNPNRR